MKKLTLFVAAAICISTGAFAQNSSLNLKKGQKYLVENKMVTTSTTEVQGQSMESNIDATTAFNIEVKDLTGNNYALSNMLSAVKMNMTQMGQNVSFDSEKKEDLDGPIGSALKDYLNKPQSVVIDKSGKVVPESGVKKDSAIDAANMISKQLGDFDATGYGATMAFEALPQSVKVGSTWSHKDDHGGIVRTTNYSVTAVNGNVATIALTGTVSTDTKMELQGMEMNVKTTGKFSGEEKADIKTGVVLSNTTTTDSAGTISVMGQDLATSAKVISTTTVKAL
jgi:hypothetical protein